MPTIHTAACLSLVLAAAPLTSQPAILLGRPATTGNAQSGPPQKATEMVTIDGSKNPELIPEWLVWQETFKTLALVANKEGSLFKEGLVLSDKEAALLYGEAGQQTERERRCFASLDQRHKELSAAGVKPEVMQKDLQDREVDCRWKTLEARDRVLKGLGPDGQASLLTWTQDVRRSIKSTVSQAGLAHYKRPQ